jgi:monooxygenase
MEHVDVLIVGAGLSGIGAACHLRKKCPDRTVVILEGRDRSGGTWDLFRYPGVRSDSDMYTLGYAFRPWKQREAIASGPAILQYLRDTASEEGVDCLVRYRHKVVRAAWSSSNARWVLQIERDGAPAAPLSCNFLFLCCGYYWYDAGYLPQFEGIEQFAGQVVHPQRWTDDIDWKGKRVVVIGSGATAMTLVPTLATAAAHVTMVQRSPTWVVARPTEDPVARRFRRLLPRRVLHALVRWKQILLGQYVFHLCRTKPERVRKMLLAGVRAGVGPQFDVDRHFVPRYNPWEQRLCLLQDGDLFGAIRSGRVSIVTDEIERFTPSGLALKKTGALDADLIVTATGLELQVFGGIALEVDGRAIDPAQAYSYKGVMFSDLPNFASIFGYSNASWTLKSDLAANYVCRVLNTMRREGHVQCTPRRHGESLGALPWIDFSSGYLVRAQDRFPKQGTQAPWQMPQNYLRDIATLRFGRVEDGTLEFRGGETIAEPAAA